MFYFSTPPYVSFAHPKATNAHSTMSLLLLLFFLNIFATHANCTAPLTNRNTQRENIHFFSQHKRPLSTPKQNCKMQFFLLSNTSMFTFSLFLSQLCSFRTKTHTFMRTPTRTHTNTHAAVFLALTLSLSLRYETLTRRCQATATRAQVQMLG